MICSVREQYAPGRLPLKNALALDLPLFEYTTNRTSQNSSRIVMLLIARANPALQDRVRLYKRETSFSLGTMKFVTMISTTVHSRSLVVTSVRSSGNPLGVLVLAKHWVLNGA